jgi:hypothetical protein
MVLVLSPQGQRRLGRCHYIEIGAQKPFAVHSRNWAEKADIDFVVLY